MPGLERMRSNLRYRNHYRQSELLTLTGFAKDMVDSRLADIEISLSSFAGEVAVGLLCLHTPGKALNREAPPEHSDDRGACVCTGMEP